MDFTTIKDMYAFLWDFIYKILEIFGITYNKETGKLEKAAE